MLGIANGCCVILIQWSRIHSMHLLLMLLHLALFLEPSEISEADYVFARIT